MENAILNRIGQIEKLECEQPRWRLSGDDEVIYLCKGVWTRVKVLPSFPWTDPLGHLSLVNDDGDVLAVVRSMAECSAEEQSALHRGLETQGFLFQIKEVFGITEEFEIWSWRVKTRQGERRLQTPLERWPRRVEGGHLLEDVSGDVFLLPEKVEAAADTREQMSALFA